MREDEKPGIFPGNRWIFREITLETFTGRHEPSKNGMNLLKYRLNPIKSMEQTDDIR